MSFAGASREIEVVEGGKKRKERERGKVPTAISRAHSPADEFLVKSARRARRAAVN